MSGHTTSHRYFYGLLIILGVILLLGFIFALSTGSVATPLRDVPGFLFAPDGSTQAQIIQEIRLPRALAALLCGALLAMAGVIMQVLLRNPLADPYILGISGGAAVGALSVILLGAGAVLITHAAFAGALLSVLLVFGLATRRAEWSATRLLLTGVVISAGWGALINVLLTTSSANNVQSMLFWLMGDLSQSKVAIWHFALLVVASLFLLTQARALNALARGELTAAALGVNVKRLKILLYFTASLATATAVTIAGSVGFVGLIVPHMMRLLGARDHRWLLPCSALAGAGFLLIADTLARTIVAPVQLPVGVLTAMIGVPAFLLILHNGYQRGGRDE